MSASDFLKNNVLNRNLTDPDTALADPCFLALCSAAPLPTDTGTTITEVSYTSYARLSVTGTDFSAAASGVKVNSGSLTFPQCTGGSDTATHWAKCSAATLGDLYDFGMLCEDDSVVEAVALDTGDIFHAEAHGFLDDDRVSLIDLLGDFPGGPNRDFSGGYFVTNKTADTFQIAGLSGAEALAITSIGKCRVGKVAHVSISNLVTPQFGDGKLQARMH